MLVVILGCILVFIGLVIWGYDFKCGMVSCKVGGWCCVYGCGRFVK